MCEIILKWISFGKYIVIDFINSVKHGELIENGCVVHLWAHRNLYPVDVGAIYFLPDNNNQIEMEEIAVGRACFPFKLSTDSLRLIWIYIPMNFRLNYFRQFRVAEIELNALD